MNDEQNKHEMSRYGLGFQTTQSAIDAEKAAIENAIKRRIEQEIIEAPHTAEQALAEIWAMVSPSCEPDEYDGIIAHVAMMQTALERLRKAQEFISYVRLKAPAL